MVYAKAPDSTSSREQAAKINTPLIRTWFVPGLFDLLTEVVKPRVAMTPLICFILDSLLINWGKFATARHVQGGCLVSMLYALHYMS